MRIAVIGNGRMGRMIDAVCAQEDGLNVAGFIGPGACSRLAELDDVDCAVDFSYPGNLQALLEDAVSGRVPLVIGTTGLSDAQGEAIRTAASVIPIVWANNFSTGVTVLARLVRMAAQALQGEFDVEITETHHRMKEDAPSGTAKMLLSAVDPQGEYAVVSGREGRPGRRGHEIGMHALRGGTVAGEHSVHFFGQMEELELRHRADSREIFARGALRAARFAMRAKPGLYDMEDVLFGGNEHGCNGNH
ncbi:MAG: 4-hydroxy-tetrahydrodipicolinate reductase [Christensenellales bacterium]|nr:4-hydroxy-tetrahydrodipicolinate reductase [Christensenellales bacterium]